MTRSYIFTTGGTSLRWCPFHDDHDYADDADDEDKERSSIGRHGVHRQLCALTGPTAAPMDQVILPLLPSHLHILPLLLAILGQVTLYYSIYYASRWFSLQGSLLPL